ncbi:fimbrial protein [Novosphingobium sp. G106]|uniref:fimbrial protein n=1 Tax=Novosphingobium sp. G106 TaxID=2849500 RepID=UPI001C2CF349|nr:fimbrial protein [Novosphingobium sp. G106]MBV1691305.1 fimbrial protein [Novosphingobium sp. G106]
MNTLFDLLRRSIGRLAGICLLLALGFSSPAQAISIVISPANLPLSPAGPYSTARDKPVGTVLATSTSTISAAGVGGLCLVTTLFLSGSAANGNTFTTGVPGLGVNFYYYNGATRTQITPGLQASLALSLSAPGTLTRVDADLIVTGPIGSGTLNALPSVGLTFAAVGLGCGVLSLSAQTLTVTANNGTVTGVTCQVANPSIAVYLPAVSVQKLVAAGQTAGATSFSISLNCATGGADVHVTLTDTTNAANTSTLPSLKGTSTAGNVKLQILRSNGSAINYGPDSAVAGTTNQWLVGPSGSISSIPLTVQYYATGVATPGLIQAAATFTLSYQ